MSEVFKVINEFEARKVDRMIFNTKEFDIEESDIAEFEKYGYKVEYIKFEFVEEYGFADIFSITKG